MNRLATIALHAARNGRGFFTATHPWSGTTWGAWQMMPRFQR